MAKLFIPVGIPGCGKSTLTKIFDHTNMRVVSSDAIREEITGDIGDQTRNQEVFAEYHKRIEDHLLDGLDVFADATNLRDFAREKLQAIGERTGADMHLIVFANPKQAVLRNEKRERRVAPDVMVRMLEQYEQALKDIPHEHYSSVTYIEAVG